MLIDNVLQSVQTSCSPDRRLSQATVTINLSVIFTLFGHKGDLHSVRKPSQPG